MYAILTCRSSAELIPETNNDKIIHLENIVLEFLFHVFGDLRFQSFYIIGSINSKRYCRECRYHKTVVANLIYQKRVHLLVTIDIVE